MSPSSESVGGQLRRERERQGLTVQKVADELRLDKVVVEAIEDDSYEGKVPPVYARGHRRKYSTLLGVPFDEGTPLPPAAPVEVAAPSPSAPRRHPPRPMRIAPQVRKLPWPQIGILAAILLVLLLFWWSPWKHQVAVQAATPTAVPSAVDAASAAAAEDAPGELVNASALVDPAPVLPAAGQVSLRLTFTAASWVEVRDASGRALFVGQGRANMVKLLSGRAPLRVRLGYAGGVHVAVNDREVPIDRDLLNGDVAHFQAGADGLLHPLSQLPPARG